MKIIIALLALFMGCSRSGPQNSSPYPPLAEQRATLANKPFVTPTRILDSLQIVTDLKFLASDSCEGRKTGSAGHQYAEQRILKRMRDAGVDSLNQSLLHLAQLTGPVRNIVGVVNGKKFPGKYIVVTAHYDHLGIQNGKTYYGADDNASGVACLLALAKYFKQNPHDYSLIFAALDREEVGLEGAHALASRLVAEYGKESVVFNLNMDMIARSDKNEIFASGLAHYPAYRYIVDAVQYKVNVKLLMGHDTGQNIDDWTMQSDHAAFHIKGIPFLYIGVEDHADYHKPTDTVDKISLTRFIENCNMIALMIKAFR